MKINKKWKILGASAAGLMSVGVVAGATFNLISSTSNNLTTTHNVNLNADATTTNGVVSPLSSYNAYSGLQTITNSIGPMLISNNGQTFGNYDWYGNLNWSITLNNTSTGLYPNSGTKVVDWNYVANKGYLYVITDTAYMFCIDSVSGDVIANLSQTQSGIQSGSNKLATIALNTQLYVWNSNTTNPIVSSVDRTTLKQQSSFTTSTNNDLNGKYLLNILDLSNDLGFNVAITSSTSPSTTISSVGAYFVTNSLSAFSASTGNGNIPSQQNISLSGITNLQDLYTNVFYHSITNSYILMVGNNLFNISLSTNAMEKSTFTQFTTNGITIQNINSGFLDANGDIYFTDSSKKIYTVNPDGKSVSQYYDLSSISYLTSDIQNAVTQIFPVINSTGSLLQGQIFVATANANFGGISNKTAVGISMFNSSNLKPTISVANSNSFNNLIPSAVTYNNFVATNSDPLTASNMQFTVDDKNGTLVVKASLTKSAWYSSNGLEKTTSIINANYSLQKASGVTSWATQQVFSAIGNGYFANKSPNQISTEDFDKYASQVLIISSSLESAVQTGSLQRTFVIKSTNTNTVTVMATVSYVDQYGTFVTYSVNDMTYTVKSETQTNFAFQGQTQYTSGATLDVNAVAALANYKNYLPSLLSRDDLTNFIAVEDGYPTSTQRRIITSNANDESGSITINVVFIGINPQTANNFSITYTGFSTFASAKIKWNGSTLGQLLKNEQSKPEDSRNQTLIDQITSMESGNVYGADADSIIDITTIPSYVNYGSLLSTEVVPTQVNLVYTTLLSNMGFQPTLSIERSDIDNEYGVITIKLDYTNSQGTNGEKLTPSFFQNLGISTKDTNGSIEYGVITQKFSGFLPIGSTYGVTLKNANSSEVKKVIDENNVDSIIPNNDLLNTLNIKGYNTDGTVNILSTTWNGEKLSFQVRAQSNKYNSVNGLYTFVIDWSPKFASIRERNLIIATVVSIIGVAIVGGAIAAYVMRKNKIRRLLK